MLEAGEKSGGSVQAIQTAAIGAHPDIAVTIFEDGPYLVMAETPRV